MKTVVPPMLLAGLVAAVVPAAAELNRKDFAVGYAYVSAAALYCQPKMTVDVVQYTSFGLVAGINAEDADITEIKNKTLKKVSEVIAKAGADTFCDIIKKDYARMYNVGVFK